MKTGLWCRLLALLAFVVLGLLACDGGGGDDCAVPLAACDPSGPSCSCDTSCLMKCSSCEYHCTRTCTSDTDCADMRATDGREFHCVRGFYALGDFCDLL